MNINCLFFLFFADVVFSSVFAFLPLLYFGVSPHTCPASAWLDLLCSHCFLSQSPPFPLSFPSCASYPSLLSQVGNSALVDSPVSASLSHFVCLREFGESDLQVWLKKWGLLVHIVKIQFNSGSKSSLFLLRNRSGRHRALNTEELEGREVKF